MDSEILTLQVDINDNPMNEKVDAIEERLSTLQKDAKQVAEDVMPSTESVPGYNDAFMRKLSDWEKSLTDIGRTRSSMEHAMSSYERENLETAYKRKIEVANNSIKDLANSQTLVQELLNSLGPGMSQVFSKGLEGIVSQLSTGIRTTAMSISSEVSRKLTDDEIVDRYMRSDEYGRIVHQLSKTDPNASKAYTSKNMRQYLMANVPMSVPQYMREAVTGGSQVPILKQPESYREMLPKSFQKIEPHAERGQIRQLGQISHANETLSTDEISALGRIVRNNRYAADAAVKAGIISKSGQKIYFNHAANHDMMDAMAGFIMDDMTRAAQGERKYGIDNVENPNFWKNISNKRGSNKVLDGTLAAAYAMHDAFGSWLNPGRFETGFTPFDAASGNAEYLGRINHSPRKTSRAFAEYTLDMMQNGAQISGMHPIVQDKNGRWTELSHINGPISAKNSPTGRAITPDDFHTISMNDSLLYKMVMSSPNAKRVGQNGFSDNMFYLKFSDELGDPGLTKERRAELQQQYADLFRNGYKVNGEDYIRTRISKTHAEFMKAAIVDDIGRKALGMEYARPGDQPLDEATVAKVRKAGLDALSNGGYSNGHSGHFDTFKPFAKTMYNQNNMATEGESLATWLGTTFGFRGNDTTAKMIRQGMGENERQRIMEDFGTPNMKVVVGSFGKADMDGSNWISDRVSNKGFQGRTFNGKATYVPINMMDMRARNFRQVEMTEEAQQRVAEINAQAQKDIEEANRTLSGKKLARRLNSIESYRAKNEAYAVAQLGGDWIIPGAGINGNDLRVPKDTNVVEDVNNIKNFKTHLQDDVKSGKITQEQMNEMRSRDYSRDEIFAKTTYDDANTSSRWLSKQVINSSMAAGFRDPRVQRYFNNVFFDELARMNDDQYVRDTLFNGDQGIDLQSEKAQKTINDHVNGMIARFNEGDRLLPTGTLKYAMAAPNPQSVINNRLKAAGIELTPEQKALELGDNQVISLESLDKQMGIIRFPATKTGNVTVDNVSAEQLIKSGGATRQQIEKLAKSRGIVDTKGLYFAPNSQILKLLQGEDFDGDLNAYFGLSDNKLPKEVENLSDAMRIVANASDKEVEELWKAKPGTPEFKAAWEIQEARKAARTKQSVPKAGGYDLRDPDDAAAYLVNAPREHAMMGSAERSADMAALYYPGLNDPKMRNYLVQAIKDYESQYDVVSTNMKTDESWRRTDEQAYAADRGLSFSRLFKYANEAVQTTGENDESVRVWNGKSQEYLRDRNVDQLGLPSLFQGSIMGTLIGRMQARQQGIDPEGGVYNWSQVFDAVKLPEGVSADSEQGKFVQMMRGVRKDFLESKYLVASNQTVDALQAQYEKAVGEIESSIDPTSSEGRALKKERLKAIGAQAFDNFKQYGATERNLANATWTQASLEDFAKQNGISVDQLVGNASFVAGVQAAVQASGPEKTFQRPEAAKNATVTRSKMLPEEARTLSEQKTAQEMLAQETPQQQAQRLLKEAGVRNRDTILDANQRDALVEAVANNDLSALMQLNGVGKKNAPKIIAALQGSSLLGLKTTSPEEMQKAVAEAIAPKLAQKEKPDEKTSASSTTTNNVPNNQPSQYGNTVPSWGGSLGGPPTPPGGLSSPPSGGNPWDKQAAQSYYGQLWDKAQAFSGKLFGETLNYENKNKGEFSSISRAKQNDAIAARYEQQIKDFQASDDYKYLLEEQKRNLDILVSPNNGLVAKAGRDFSEMSMYSSSQLLENIGTAEEKASGTYDAQVEALNKWDEKIKEVEADQKRLLTMSSDPKYSKNLQNQFKQSADKIGEDLIRINASRQNLGSAMQDQNQKTFDKQIENLENRLHPGNKYQQQSRQYKEQINSIRENLTSKHNAGLISDASFSKDISRLDELEKKSSTSALAISDAFKKVGTSISRSVTNLASRFGRQLFQKALTEAKKFVQEFDKSMTSIQMITLKSDEQMSTLGDSLIAKAKELKISVAEITQSAETLYRQGLSDEEVNERLDVISKFSKVSGTKVDAATKLITVAMNTGLVTDPQIAADIVTALGDNAATNASEIEKGIEKAGAAAAADGTTFAQLASMLTAITSTTQIGGNVAGRTLNTIFGRMNKIGTNELIYDENGNAISGSDVSKLLAAQGIRTYDEKGNKRSSYDVLYDLSQVWDSLEDATQQQLASQIAGTRQYSNFAAIMQGMSEGKVSEYMSLSESAEGITDKKYEIYTKSLQASLTDLKNTFDALVNDLVDKGYVQEFISGITTMINGVDNLVNALGGLQMALPLVMTLVGAINGLKFGGVGALVGAVIGLGSYAGLTALGQGDNNVDFEQITIDERKKQTEAARSSLEKAQNMYESYKNGGLSEEEVSTLDKLLSDIDASISGAFSEAERAALGLSGTFENVSDKLDAYAAAIEAKTKNETEQQFRKDTSVDLSSVVASRYENGDGRTYTEDEKAFYDYITENYADDGMIGWGHNGVEDYFRDIVSRGLSSDGRVRPGVFLDVYRDRINEWIKQGKFIQTHRKEGDEYTPIPYTDIQDLYRDLATYDFVDENGIETQTGGNVEKLFELLMTSGGDAGFNENMESQEAFARDVVSTTYGDRLKTSLSKLGYVDDNLASLVTDAYIDSIMQGVRGQIIESNAIGGEPDIPGKIADESKRLIDNMYNFLQADDPLKAFQDYVIESKKQDTEFLEEHAEELKGLNDEGMSAAIRGILFPAAPTLEEEEAQEIAQDVLHAGAATGYSTWSTDKSNAYGLAADAMLRNLESAGVSDAESLRAYLQTTDGRDWKYLTQNNGELAQLVNSIQYDKDGNIINPDVYNQIIDTLYANSKARGARFVPGRERAEKAQSMLTSIAKGEVGYLSWQDALAAAEAEEQANRDAYEASIQEELTKTREKYRETLSPEELEKGMARYEELYRERTPYTGQTAEQIAAGYRIYTADEQKYLKETVGEELYDRLTGKNGQTASIEEQTYAQTLVNNKRYGISGLTSRQQLEGMRDIQRIISEGGLANYSEPVANAYMAQFAGWGEYSALIKRQQAGEILSPKEQEQLEALQQNFDNIVQSAQIKVDIEGVQQLEEAGEVAEGTASKLERLKKGGDIALRVSYEIQNEAYGTAQLGARLSGGTREEQIEAIKSLTGYTDTQIQKMGFENALADANVLFNSKNNRQISSLEELYANAKTDEEKAVIDRIANNAGYGNQYDKNGNVIAGKYTLRDNPVDREDRFYNAERLFQATTIANAQKEIIEGTLTANTYGRENEYNTAAARLGEQSTEYLRMLRVGGYSQEDLETQRAKAEAEVNKMYQDAVDQDALKEAELNNASLGGMFNYLQVQHSQQNKASAAAEEIFGSLSDDNIKNFTDLATSVNGDQADNWKKLLEATPDLANKLSQLGAKVDDSGNIDFSGVESSGYSLASVLDLLSTAAANAAENLNNYNTESTGEKYANAMAYLNGESVVDEQSAHDALSTIFGNEQIAAVVAENRNRYNTGFNQYLADNGYISSDGYIYDETTGRRISSVDDYRSKYYTPDKYYNQYEGLTDYNRRYAETLEENAQSGQTGLTDVQRAEFLQEIVSAANLRQSADVENSLGWLRNQDKVGAWQDITSGVEGVDKWLAASERLNEHGMSMEDLANLEEGSEQWNVANEAVKDYYGSVEGAQEAQKEMDRQLATESIRLTQRFGDQTSTVADKMKKLSGSIQEQDEVLSEMTTNWDNYNKSVYVKNQFENGSTNWSDVTSILGGSDNLWKNTDRDVVLGKLNAKVEVNEQEVINDTNARLNNILSQLSEQDIKDLSPIIAQMTPTMTWDVSTLSALAAEFGLEANSIIQELISNLANTNATVVFNAEAGADGKSIQITADTTGVTATNSGGGYSGGGGGGGESEVSKLTKKLGFYETEKKHVATMLSTQETALDFTNNFLGWAHNLDEQVEAQNALADQYRSNLEELTAEMSSVEEYSDDWYTLTDAIMTAEEALAEVENEINTINAKRISIVESKQEIEDKPQTHALTMLQKYASRYQTNDNFESYKAIMQETIKQSQAEIDQNNAQIAEWEELLRTYQENSDSWNDVRDKIWAIKEENAELENQMASDTISLQEAEISQIAADLENSQRYLVHENAMLDIIGGMHQSVDNQERYRQVLQDTNANNEALKASTDEAIEQIKEQINSMKESDPARKTAIQTLYQLEETSAQYEASILSNRQAIEESFINQISRTYTDNGDTLEHELKLLTEAEKEFLRNDDLVNYENILNEKVRNTTERLENQQAALEEYLALQNSGKITEGSQQWKNLEETIRSTKESIAALKNEQAETLAAFQQSQFENLQTRYREGVVDEYEGMDQLQHEQSLINYRQTLYQNRGELTNYGTALGWENDNLEEQREAIERQIKAVKELQGGHRDNPELFKKETEALRKLEEELSKNAIAIEKNVDAQKKNQIAILTTVANVKKTADSSIRELIQKERNMLSATVNVQNTILDAIRQNYQEQWNLEKKTLDKKKQALSEEKNLIAERLNFRKKMIDQEAKDEELAEYKRQLALISADSTRTKDANELRRKINEMERDKAIQTAEDIANAEIKSNEDRARSIDNYIAVYEEDLNNLLKNSNNFREELDSLMNGSFEDFIEWNFKYNERYKYATEEQREQMKEGWEDTWYDMLGMLRLYWDEAEEVSRTKEGWLALATSTDSFRSLSPEEQDKRLIELQDMYEAMENARIDNATFDDQHEMINKIDELKKWTFDVRVTGIEDYLPNSGFGEFVYNRDTNTYGYQPDTDYAGVGKAVSTSYSGGGGGGGGEYEDSSSGGSDSASGSSYTPSNKNVAKDNNTEDHLGSSLYDLSGMIGSAISTAISTASYGKAKQGTTGGGLLMQTELTKNNGSISSSIISDDDNEIWTKKKYASGGLVDYTGLAWVDGTKTRPESFLDSTDTAILRGMLDAFDNVKTTPYMSNIDSSNFCGTNISVGDVNVNLYEAKLENDADYDKVAQQVGKAFTKQLQKDGFNLAAYAW